MANSEIVDELLSITQITEAEMVSRKGCWAETKQRLSLVAAQLGYPYEEEAPHPQLELEPDPILEEAPLINSALPLTSRTDDA